MCPHTVLVFCCRALKGDCSGSFQRIALCLAMPATRESKADEPASHSGPRALLSNQWSCDSLKEGQKRMKRVKKEQLEEEEELQVLCRCVSAS